MLKHMPETQTDSKWQELQIIAAASPGFLMKPDYKVRHYTSRGTENRGTYFSSRKDECKTKRYLIYLQVAMYTS